MATAAVMPATPVPGGRTPSRDKCHRSSKAKKNASGKEKVCSQTEEIVKGYILGGIGQDHQYAAIHRCCLRVVEDYKANFTQLCKKLRPSRESLHSNFMTVFGSLFNDEITVGKIVTSIAFGGKLVEYCSENGLDVTDNLIAWILDYFKHYVSPWILNYGGWEKIEQKLSDGHIPKIPWSSIVLDTLTLGISFVSNFLY